jgi:ATP-binding cassette subfamily C protein
MSHVTGEHPGTGHLYALGVALVVFIVLKNMATIQVYRAQARAAADGVARLSARLARGYMAAPFEYHLERKNVQYHRGLWELPGALYFRSALSCCNLIAEIGGVAVITVALAVLEPLGVLSALAFLGVLLLINHRVGGRYFQAWGTRTAQLARRVHGLANQIFPNMKIVKTTGAEPVFADQFIEPLREASRIEASRRVAQLSVRPISEIAMMLAAAIILTAVLSGAERAIEALPFVAVFAYGAIRLLPSMNRMSMFANEMKNARPLIDELKSELAGIAPYEGGSGEAGRITNVSFTKSLGLEGIGYSYPDGSLPALSGIDLTILYGEVIGLAGTSGAGKSTLVDIMLGLLEPTEGRLLVDGEPPRRGRVGDRAAGYVPQTCPLINGTVRENIAFGVPPAEVDEAALHDAARAARVFDAIMAMPEEFESQVGESGTRLSGGQRQRIGIARALYGRPSLLVLDEATSDLDTRTEFEVSESINALRGKITIVLVAHRLHVLKSADRIVFLKSGRVDAVGSYDALLETCPGFRDLEAALGGYDSGPTA